MSRAIAVAGRALGLAVLLADGAYAQQTDFARGPVPPPLFRPTPVAVSYERDYTKLEECLAAVGRSRRLAQWGVLDLVDDPTRPEPAPVVEVARRCAARFDDAAVGAAALPLLRELYHYAEQDSLAEVALARELALLPMAAPEARFERLHQAIRFALNEVRPARLAWVERRLGEIERDSAVTVERRFTGYLVLLQYAGAVYDTIRIDRYSSTALAILDSAAAVYSGSPDAEAYFRMFRDRIIEYQRLRAVARGEVVTSTDSALAPPLVADFWFRRPDATTPRPTPGRGGLVVFVDPACETYCYDRYAVVRELGERFGDALEITLVTHTHGYFRNYPPLEPAEEAELLRHYFFEHVKLPGTLAVETSRVNFLPTPDGRQVSQAPPNVLGYRPENLFSGSTPAFGIGFLPHLHHDRGVDGYLVDRDGRILFRLPKFGKDKNALMIAAISGWLARTGPKS